METRRGANARQSGHTALRSPLSGRRFQFQDERGQEGLRFREDFGPIFRLRDVTNFPGSCSRSPCRFCTRPALVHGSRVVEDAPAGLNFGRC
jgi:hypothetical protein